MASPRLLLSVVVVPPAPVADELLGVRRLLGTPSLVRQPPHITIVPPVHVHPDEAAAVTALVRSAADASGPLRLQLGPVAAFPPTPDGTCALHLSVSGPGAPGLDALRHAVFRGPLLRNVAHPFVAHLTLHESLPAARVPVARELLAGAGWDVTVDQLVVVRRGERGWEPWCSAPLGGGVVRGRGGLGLVVRRVLVAGPEALAGGLVEPTRRPRVEPGPIPVDCPDRRIVEVTDADGTVIAAAVSPTVDPSARGPVRGTAQGRFRGTDLDGVRDDDGGVAGVSSWVAEGQAWTGARELAEREAAR